MSKAIERRKSDLVDKIVGLVEKKFKKDAAQRAARFVRHYYRWAPAEDLLGETPENLLGAALSLWRFAARRPAGTAMVRVVNPRIAEQGWKSSHTILEIVTDDMPFLVDSVAAALNQLNLTVDLVIHPVLHLTRDKTGRLRDVFDPDDAPETAVAESFMHVEIATQTDPAKLEAVQAEIEAVLADVRAAVEDWRPLLDLTLATSEGLNAAPAGTEIEERQEAQAFLRWVHDNHFTFLGARDYDYAPGAPDSLTLRGESGLGILRDPKVDLLVDADRRDVFIPELTAFLDGRDLLLISKSGTRARVHRPVHMDVIGVKRFDADGRVAGMTLFAGLFTSVAYSRSPREIPFLRRKVARVFERSGLSTGGHDGKALLHILETYPRDELFQVDEATLADIALGILQLQERQRLALFVRADPFGRFFSLLIYVPRDRFNSALRLRMQEIVEDGLGGRVTAFYTQIGDEPLARLHFIVKTDPAAPVAVDAPAIEERLTEAARSWSDDFKDALIDAKGEETGLSLFARYGGAFPSAYRERFDAPVAVFDLERIEAALKADALEMNLYRPLEAAGNALRFKLYHPGTPIPLSDVLPVLENMGLRVIDEIPYQIRPRDSDGRVWVHDFGLETRDGSETDLAAARANFHEAFARVWAGAAESDGFNRLVLGAGIDWRRVAVLRAYCKYLRQTGILFSQAYMEDTLAANPTIAARLAALFDLRFDPREVNRREVRTTALIVAIEEALDAVANLDQDRILRRFLNLIRVTLRTNFYRTDDDGAPRPFMSFKIDSRAVDELPLPRPMVEIFVYSPRMEGVHLRGGKVARGGIRWSDRPEDFRTEILGLMKAQMVKNSVIVPVGSKGGFVVKRPPPAGAGRAALQAEVIACYRQLVSGMLDITDNRDGEAVLSPPGVVRHDEDDPYLVVAADKGTATFSDIANEVSRAYGFWLDDAFASGGSAGYDHKKMGITARGAWESVKRHFREMGKDIQKEDFTVVGVGDMSGDVFGNGMLLSKHIRLIGAFNHLHIFIDPDPDPAKSHAERKRLFETPGTAWTDYAPKLISKGGGVFDRSAKSIDLTPQMKDLLGAQSDRLTPNEVIRRLLVAPVELLWFGGIGTFIRAGFETDAEVGDRANDAVRVTADALNCAVIGEGGNLGITQNGRIEYARAGGRLNTDAIDNSGGVDASDHEVNIKILVGDVVARGDMTMKQRNNLLARMTDEVADLVLRDNYQQPQALTVVEAQGLDGLDAQERLIRALERKGLLDRAIEFLPDDEALAERRQAGQGLTRPELSVLLAYAKIALYAELLASDLPDEEDLFDELVLYFPKPLRGKHKSAIRRHRLRREIIATVVTNSIVNRMGPCFVNDLAVETGQSPSQIARVYAVTRSVFGLREVWAAVEGADNRMPASLQAEMLATTIRLAEGATKWFLRGEQPIDIARIRATYGDGIGEVAAKLDKMLSKRLRAETKHRAGLLRKKGAGADLARRIAELERLDAACDIVAIARGGGVAVADAGRIYFALGERFGFDGLRQTAAGLAPATVWEKQALIAVQEDLRRRQGALTMQVLDAAGSGPVADKMTEIWIDAHAHAVAGVDALLADIAKADSVDLAMLTVAAGRLRALVGA